MPSKITDQKRFLILFFLMIALSAILRIYKLSSIPPGFANDEAAVTYQAYSILLTQKDTWGNFLPVLSFKDFGEYLPPFAVYAQIPFIKILGLNEFAARLPFALTGIFSTIAIYFLVQELFNKKPISLLSCFLFAVSPFNIGWSRFVYEGNFGSLFYLLGLTFFVLSRKKSIFLPFSVIFFGLTFTTYHIYYFVTPLTGIFLFIINAKKIIKGKYFNISLVITLAFILYAIMIVASGSGRERFRQVSIFSKGEIINELNINRSMCKQNLPSFFCRLLFNKVVAYGYEYSFNYFSHFSPQFLALNGSFLRQSILPTHGLIYPFEIAFFYIGIIVLFVRKNFSSLILLFWLFIYPISNSFTGLGEISRIGFAMPLFPIVTSLGLITVLDFFKKIKKFNLAFSVILLLAVFNITSFIVNYFYVFPKKNSKFGSQAYVQLFKKLNKDHSFDKIYITRDYMGSAPEFQARIFLPINPFVFQDRKRNDVIVDEEKKYINYRRLDNYYFFHNPDEIKPNSNDLVVKSKNQITRFDRVLFEIKENDGESSLFGTTSKNVIP